MLEWNEIEWVILIMLLYFIEIIVDFNSIVI